MDEALRLPQSANNLSDRELLEKIANNLSEFKAEVRNEFDEVKTDLSEFKVEVRNEFAEVRNDISDIRFIIENEIRNNISIIAEAHMDIFREIKAIRKTDERIENLSIRTSLLETKVRHLEEVNTPDKTGHDNIVLLH